MNGREDQKANDLFFLCSLIDYIARKTKNRRVVVVDALGKERLSKIFELSDVYHSDNIDRVSDDFIEEANISKVAIAKTENCDIITALEKAYHSFISDKIDDYNSSVYYDNPQNIFIAYQTGSFEE